MRISFHGGVEEVTGSRHLIECGGRRVLLDCGLFQGHRSEALGKNRNCPFPPAELAAAVLSHAHMDHSGGLPLLVKKGFAGSIHCTRPTADLCGIMFMDSARLQKEDAKFFNKIHAGDGQTIEPLYGEEDAEETLARLSAHGYGEPFSPAPGVKASFLNAGHVLGSAMPLLELEEGGRRLRLLFTGDLGRRRTLLMEQPAAPEGVDALVIETTYGDRLHDALGDAEGQLAETVLDAVRSRGKVLIPSFALERTQEIVFILEKLRREKRIPPVPVYVDSPMAVSITEVFQKHLDCFCFDDEFRAYASREGDPFGFEDIRYLRTKEESQRLNDRPGPMIIVSASGMCEGGRILHHLRNNIEKDSTTILLVGYQAGGTLGRRLADGQSKVRIFGLEHPVGARVRMLHTFSSHADRDDLLAFIGALKPAPKRIFLVHGDPSQRAAFAERLRGAGYGGVETPRMGEAFEL